MYHVATRCLVKSHRDFLYYVRSTFLVRGKHRIEGWTEPIMLQNLPVILPRISQIIHLLFPKLPSFLILSWKVIRDFSSLALIYTLLWQKDKLSLVKLAKMCRLTTRIEWQIMLSRYSNQILPIIPTLRLWSLPCSLNVYFTMLRHSF